MSNKVCPECGNMAKAKEEDCFTCDGTGKGIKVSKPEPVKTKKKRY